MIPFLTCLCFFGAAINFIAVLTYSQFKRELRIFSGSVLIYFGMVFLGIWIGIIPTNPPLKGGASGYLIPALPVLITLTFVDAIADWWGQKQLKEWLESVTEIIKNGNGGVH